MFFVPLPSESDEMNDIRQKKRNRILLASVFTLAGVVYALISFVNHYLFKTYALDLGLYTHFMYEYAHFRHADLFMLDLSPQSALSTHFDLYLVLLSPLVYVFGSYTLLVVQFAAVLFGGYGIYKLISLYSDDDFIPILATVAFFFSFGVIHALSYDYHSNVVSAMMMPWLLYCIKKGRFVWASVFVVLLVIGKENMSLWLFFIVLGLMWDYRKNRKAMWHLLAFAVFSVAYFLVINMIVMPKIGGEGISRYHHLGDNYAEIALQLITHPGETIRHLSTNTSEFGQFDGIKEEFYLCALATGLIFTILKPNYLVMLIPLIGQKMLSSYHLFWGISFQYSIEFVPVLVISSFLVILRVRKLLWQRVLSLALLLSVLLTLFYTIGVPKAYVVPEQLCIYQGRHYEQSRFDADYARELIRQIPDDAYVCASTMFVPHLALRHYIEDFVSCPNTGAEYVLITKPYFESRRDGQIIFSNRDDFETVATDGTIFLLKRKSD